LSNTTTRGRSAASVASTCGVLRVGESSQSWTGKSTASRNTALRLTRKWLSMPGSARRNSRAMIRQRISSPEPCGPDTGTNSTRGFCDVDEALAGDMSAGGVR
jgi:hypothetical protein